MVEGSISNKELTTYLEIEELLFKYEVVTGKYLIHIYVSLWHLIELYESWNIRLKTSNIRII